MNWYLKGFCGLFLQLTVITVNSFAQTPTPAATSTNSNTETEIFINNDVACGKINNKWLAGTLKRNTIFTSYKDTLAKLKLQIKEASAAKALKLENKSKKFKLLNKTGTKICKGGPPTGTPTPVQTPSQTQTPAQTKTPSSGQPTATPTPKSNIPPPVKGCFSASGDTTCFGIGDQGLTGNITRGKNIYENGNGISTSCTGCHQESERRNLNFSQVSNAFQTVTEMLTYRNDFSQQNYADLVAYLNRFN